MRKILFVLLLSLFLDSVVLSQIDYSESAAYQPRKNIGFQESKPKKEKKSKNNAPTENKVVSSVENGLSSVGEETTAVASRKLTVPVSIFDAKGIAVRDLKKPDFKVFVDGEEQKSFTLGTTVAPLNVVLVIDVSASAEERLEQIQQYAFALIGKLRPQDKASIIAFADRAQILAELTDDRQTINKAIKSLKIGDGTSLFLTVKTTLPKQLGSIDGRKIVVLLTDGVDTTSRGASYQSSLLEAEKSDAVFYPAYLDTYQDLVKATGGRTVQLSPSTGSIATAIIGSAAIEYQMGRQYLDDLASLSGGRSVIVKNVTETRNTGFERVFDELTHQYYINFNLPDGGNSGKRHQIKVRVNRPNLSVTARGSYLTKDS